MAWHFLGENDPDSAIPDFDQAIYLAPNSAEAYCLRGQAFAKKGDYYRAISDATAAIRSEARLCPGILPSCRRLWEGQ